MSSEWYGPFRDYLVEAGVMLVLYAVALAWSYLAWFSRPALDDDGPLPLAAAAAGVAALLAWALLLFFPSLDRPVATALELLRFWGSNSLATALLLLGYFYAEAVGVWGATGLRGRLAESAVLAAGALLLARVGSFSLSQLAPPVALSHLLACLSVPLLVAACGQDWRLRLAAAASCACAAVASVRLWTLLVVAASLWPGGGGTPVIYAHPVLLSSSYSS